MHSISVVDRQRFDADPDSTFRFDIDSDPDLDTIPRLTHVGIFFLFSINHRRAS